ncbi:MAG: hypothetical protein PHS46_07700 [Candidatus Omnitrophica bacterium]|nr:hypothetical protein [Candidatus Omnitrophota bacterium]
MKTTKIFIAVILVLAAVSATFVFSAIARAQDQGGDQSAILSKLDQVLTSQKDIMDQMASIKNELAIIKIRVTQQT